MWDFFVNEYAAVEVLSLGRVIGYGLRIGSREGR